MKKLNRKGFTLIELLAIIVILAIIMVVTFPNILDAISSSRQKTFANSANSVADWVEEQYALAVLNQANSAFTNVCTAPKYCKDGKVLDDITGDTAAFLKAAGVVPGNYTKASISLNNGRACVILWNNNEAGDFANISAEGAPNLATEGDGRIKVSSNGCSE